MIIFKMRMVRRCRCHGCGVCKEFKRLCDNHRFTANPSTDGHPCNGCPVRNRCEKHHSKKGRKP